MRGAIGSQMRGHRPGLIMLPFAFTTDAAGAVVVGSEVGEGYTVAQAAGNGRYTFTLTEKYTALLAGGFVGAATGMRAIHGEVVSDTVNSNAPTVTVCATQHSGQVRLLTPVALNAAGLHAAYAGTQAVNNMTAGIIGAGVLGLTDNPRKVTATFVAGWDGGDITITGADAITGLSTTEVLSGLVGGGVSTSVNAYSTITALAKGAVGIDAATVTVGWNNALSVRGLVGSAGVGDVNIYTDPLAVLTWEAPAALDAQSVTPTTVCDGALNYLILGDFRRPVDVVSQTVYGHLLLSSFGVRRA